MLRMTPVEKRKSKNGSHGALYIRCLLCNTQGMQARHFPKQETERAKMARLDEPMQGKHLPLCARPRPSLVGSTETSATLPATT
jgi:hypothetical protein